MLLYITCPQKKIISKNSLTPHKTVISLILPFLHFRLLRICYNRVMGKTKKIGTGSERGTFSKGDKHPWLEGRTFYQYVTVDGICQEHWMTPEQSSKRKAYIKKRTKLRSLINRKKVKSHQTMLPKGYFKRGDKHPWQASLLFSQHRNGREEWISEEAIEKRELTNARYRHSMRGTSIKSESKRIDQLYLMRRRVSDCTGIEFQVDHTVPISKGGTHTLNNLEVVPAIWNSKKSNSHCERWIKA